MSRQLIISVGREFGSAGHEIAQKLAEHYKIELLDHNLLDEIALNRGLDASMLKDFDEKDRNPLLSRTIKGMSNSNEVNVSLIQFDFLQKKAEAGDSFVIVGRCSESVLKDYDSMISIFILGNKEAKVKRIMELYHMNDKMAEKFMNEKDMRRKRYHNGFCEGKWGDSRYYDISVNSSILGVDGTTELLVMYIDKKIENDLKLENILEEQKSEL